MKKEFFKTALIGCGRIGFLLESDPLRNKPCTHFGGAKAAGIRIGFACDSNIERLAKFSAITGIAEENIYTDYKKLIKEQRPELIIIATPTFSHAEIGLFGARNGVKTIICEKPLAANLDDALVLIQECEKHGVKLIVNHERRYDPRYRLVKKIIDNERIGEVNTVHASMLTPAYARKAVLAEGGGTLLHDGTHMIDIIRYFFGEIKSVRGELKKQKNYFEESASAWLKTKNNIDVFIEAGCARDYFMFELVISASKGRVVIGNGYQHLFLAKKSRLYTGFSDLGETRFPKANGMNCFKREYLEAKDSLLSENAPITSSGYDGYKALETIHAIYLSSHLKSRIIDLPLEPKKVNLRNIFSNY